MSENDTRGTDPLLWVDPDGDPHFRALGRRLDGESSGYYFHMFLDDAGKICGYRDDEKKYSIQSDRISEDQVLAAIGGEESSYGVNRVLDEFFESIMHDLIMYGVSHWAIATDTRYENGRRGVASTPFRIYRVPGWTIRRFGMGYRQLVPKEYATSRHRRNIRILDRRQIFQIRIRGGRGSQLRRFMRFVRAADRWYAHDHKMTMDELSSNSFGSSREDRNRIFATHFLRRTRNVGWSARQLHNEKMIEPTFTAYRNLVFQEFLAGCREQIIEVVNERFGRLGRRLNFSLQISTPGLLSSERARQLRSTLYSGSGDIVDLMTMTAETQFDLSSSPDSTSNT